MKMLRVIGLLPCLVAMCTCMPFYRGGNPLYQNNFRYNDSPFNFNNQWMARGNWNRPGFFGNGQGYGSQFISDLQDREQQTLSDIKSRNDQWLSDARSKREQMISDLQGNNFDHWQPQNLRPGGWW